MLSEDALIARLTPPLAPRQPVAVGVGDDAACLNMAHTALLIACDAMHEHVHFDLRIMGLDDAAYRCLAANLSDIAAMGGTPGPFTLALGVPPSGASASDVDALTAGFLDTLHDHHVPPTCGLVGGDTFRSPGGWSLCITLLGQPPLTPCLRAGAQPHDRLCLFRPIGDSAAGLAWLLADAPEAQADHAIRAFRRPRAECQLGPLLAQPPTRVRALIDLSDGLGRDLSRLLSRSHVGARIQLEAIPHRPQLSALAQHLNVDPWTWIIGGGEDYTLCAALAPDHVEPLRQRLQPFGRQLFDIGEVRPEHEGLQFTLHGTPLEPTSLGYEHW